MGVELSPGEIESLLDRSHTGVLTTLRADGRPVSLPVWFVRIGDAVYVRTPSRSAKVDRLRRDDRVCFLVEDGLAWDELTAVVLQGRADVVEDPTYRSTADQAFDAKYDSYRARPSSLPDATQRHYAGSSVVLRIPIASDDTLSWDNRKIRRRQESM